MSPRLPLVMHEMARGLRAHGLVVHEGYGHGEAPVDLAIEDPDNPGVLALAVESDGPQYASLATVRDRDLIGRWGGEEFVLVFPGADRSVALSACERIRDALRLEQQDATVPPFTASFGVSDTDQAGSLDEYAVDLLVRFDHAFLSRDHDLVEPT